MMNATSAAFGDAKTRAAARTIGEPQAFAVRGSTPPRRTDIGRQQP
ncbi:hypothetical protein [Sphingomonas sp. 1P08PE]